MKLCTSCETEKETLHFTKRKASRKDGLSAWCKDCVRAYQRTLRLRRREEAAREYRAGLSNKIFDVMLQEGMTSTKARDVAETITQELLSEDGVS